MAKLVSPRGREYITDDPVTINNLVHGQGYRMVDDEKPVEHVVAEKPPATHSDSKNKPGTRSSATEKATEPTKESE